MIAWDLWKSLILWYLGRWNFGTWDGDFGTWDGRIFGTWDGEILGTWDGDYGTWDGDHGTWDGEFGTWDGGIQIYKSSFFSASVNSLMLAFVGFDVVRPYKFFATIDRAYDSSIAIFWSNHCAENL